MAPDSSPPLPAGQPEPLFPGGEYAIDGVLGSGGMAIVYRARDLRRPRTVAIKVLRLEVARAMDADRFLREIAVTAAFSHPHILPLLDSGEAIDAEGRATPFYVMPLIEGESLATRLRVQNRLPIQEGVRLACEVLEALRYAHEHGVIHRDIKPANVLLSDGHAVVADFGVSGQLRGPGYAGATDGITVVGTVLGTPAYMSPEQALGDAAVDARCDLYAVGCVLYEMLAGVSPFEASTPRAIISRKVAGSYEPVSRLRPGIPQALDDLLGRALAPEPADRFGSAGEFLAELSRLDVRASGSGQTMRFPAPAEPQRIGRVFGAAVVLAMMAVGAWAIRRGMDRARTPAVSKEAQVVTAGLSKAHVAVLLPEILDADSVVANALHGDLIDELARYPALTVISRNGVIGFTGARARADSVSRVLGVGSVITSSVRGTGDSVWVTVRLIDGSTSAQVASHVAAGRRRDVLAVRSELLDSLTTILRKQIGVALRRTDEQAATVAEAWELVAQAGALGLTLQAGTVAERRATLARVDSLLTRAERLDPRWPRPYERRVAWYLTRADLEATVDADEGTSLSPAALRRQAVRLADSALAKFPNAPGVLLQRGHARLELWRAASSLAPDSLRDLAQADLEAAVAGRRDLAMGWYYLSQLFETNGDFESARAAAENARLADAFLEKNADLQSRLMFAALVVGDEKAARRACLQGLKAYPKTPLFWTCELLLLAWTARQPSEMSAAWEALRAAEQRDPDGAMAPFRGQPRLLVAAVAARVGLADSARAIVRRVRAEPQPEAVAAGLDLNEAYVRTLLGEKQLALPLLASFLGAAPASRGYVRRHPWFSPLANDSTFARLTSRP